jgi:capsular exopolysaccharide synthesis family protein
VNGPQSARRPAGAPRRLTAPGAPPPGLSAGPDARSLLRGMRRRWLLASSVGVGTAVVVLLTLLVVLPQKYLAFATVQVASFPEKAGGRSYINDFMQQVKTNATRIKSRDVLVKALAKEKVRNLGIVTSHPSAFSVITWLEEYLKVDTQDNNELISVSLPGDDPEELVVLLDAITHSYLQIVNGKESGQRKKNVERLQKVANNLKEKLETKMSEEQTLFKGKAPDPAKLTLRVQAMLQQLNEAQRNLTTTIHEMEKAKSKLAAVKAAYKAPGEEDVPDTALQPLIENNSLLKPHLQQLGRMEQILGQMDLGGTPYTNVWYRELVAQSSALRKKITAEKKKIRTMVVERYRKKVEGDHKQLVAAMQLEVKPLEDLVKNHQERVEALTQQTENLGYTNAKIEEIKLEKESLVKQHAEVDKQLKTYQIEEDAEFRVTGCQDAVWQVKDPKRRMMILIAVPLVAAVGGAALVGWLEFRARRIHSADEVAVGLGMRVVGAVPALAEGAHRQMLSSDESSHDHELVESIDAIRTTLLRSASDEPTKVVMVTSAVGGEGKTTLASNLAVSLARAGRRTLLIDCDLRRPALHQLFEQTLQPGFSEVLLGEVDLPDAVRPTTTDDHLWLLPAGQWDREVIQELARGNLPTLLERLKEEFDFVVVDSHPVLPATDSLLIGQHADAVIVSLLRGVSQAPRVYAAYQRLATLDIRVFGTVVNGMPNDTYGHGSHYDYTAASAA